jgi:hypothetical protein
MDEVLAKSRSLANRSRFAQHRPCRPAGLAMGVRLTPFYVTAPLDPRLPGGGGYKIGPFYNETPGAILVPNGNVIKLGSDFGKDIQIWSGVDSRPTFQN